MRFLIQSVSQASIHCDDGHHTQISRGVVIYLGISRDDLEDYPSKTEKIIKKLSQSKLLKSEDGNISASLEDIGGEIALVSNFTLYGDNNKWNKINFSKSAAFTDAKKIYDYLVQEFKKNFPTVQTGSFGTMMEVSTTNDGPINYIRDV